MGLVALSRTTEFLCGFADESCFALGRLFTYQTADAEAQLRRLETTWGRA